MSVMVISKETFQKIGNSRVMLNNCTGGNIYSDELEEIVKSLYHLNIISYNLHYDDNLQEENLNLRTSKKKFNNHFELLKALQCLKYNIELNSYSSSDKQYNTSYKEESYLEWLDEKIKGIMSYILNDIEEYKLAQWG